MFGKELKHLLFKSGESNTPGFKTHTLFFF